MKESSMNSNANAISNGMKGVIADNYPDIILRPVQQVASEQGQEEGVEVILSSSSDNSTIHNATLRPSFSDSSRKPKMKAPPVCRIPSLRKEHMTSDHLSKWCFSPTDVWSLKIQAERQKEEDKMQLEMKSDKILAQGNGNGPISPQEWQLFKKNILNRKESRNGRETQRFATDAQGQLLRLTTGCVPIMNDGKILLVSSSRKGEWILPKGGWESDESMQESALRETYEEGGILGVIGPKLSGIEFETRKAKKRRLELESRKKKYEIAYSCGNTLQQQQTEPNISSIVSVQSNSSSLHYQSEDDQAQVNGNSNVNGNGNNNSQSSHKISNDSQTTAASDRKSSATLRGSKDYLEIKIRNELVSNSNGNRTENERHHDNSTSIASSEFPSSCTHVRLCMFPLYVLEVRENWPESGRARKVVDIDTAIEIMSQRPEFHQVLMEVKQNGLHLKPHHQQQVQVQVQDGNDKISGIKTKTITPTSRTALSIDSEI